MLCGDLDLTKRNPVMIKHYALLFVAILPLAAAAAQVTDSTVALPLYLIPVSHSKMDSSKYAEIRASCQNVGKHFRDHSKPAKLPSVSLS